VSIRSEEAWRKSCCSIRIAKELDEILADPLLQIEIPSIPNACTYMTLVKTIEKMINAREISFDKHSY